MAVSLVKLYCDMDGVLVQQTGRDGFDKMPWTIGGRELWAFIKDFRPTLLSQLPDENWARCMPQKVSWSRRELGIDVPIFVVLKSQGKARFAAADAILIDDGAYTHGKAWLEAGGIFVHHIDVQKTIIQLKLLLQ